MTDLVERVAMEQAIADGVRWNDLDAGKRQKQIDLRVGSARAAIRAVLEFYSEPGNVSDEMARRLVECENQWGWKPSIAAAMRSELERMKP